MRLICALVVLSSAILSAQSPYISEERRAQFHGSDSEAAEPFRVIGNIYFVGAKSLSSYLITTPEGHILHDTGTNEMHDVIVSNVEALGFDVRDIKFMLHSHAHFDHMQGHAAMQRATGAQIVALGGDAVAIESGEDNSALGDEGWEPVEVARVVEDGDTLTLGGMTLRAVWTGGHTQGATMWMTTVEEEGQTYTVAFRGGEIPNPRGPARRQSAAPDGRRRHTANPTHAEGARPPRSLPAQSPTGSAPRAEPESPRQLELCELPRRRGMGGDGGKCRGQISNDADGAVDSEGGMGEVYRARDTKLDRDVALKVVSQAFTDDPDRLARFEREQS